MRSKQLNLFIEEKCAPEFGGSLRNGKRKSTRPLSTSIPIHLVLKAENPFLLLRNTKTIEQIAQRFSARFGVRVYEIAVQADHVHFCIQIPSRELYCRWIRALTSALTNAISGLKWKLRPYTRLGSWGREFSAIKNYMCHNREEAQFLLAAHQTVEDFANQWIALLKKPNFDNATNFNL